jgi:hypothetical protein
MAFFLNSISLSGNKAKKLDLHSVIGNVKVSKMTNDY